MKRKHATCVETTSGGERSWMCGEACLDAPEISDIAAAVEAERKRIRAVLAGPLLMALRAIPDGQRMSGCYVIDGAIAREQARAAWREAFPLTDEVAAHLREVLKGGQS